MRVPSHRRRKRRRIACIGRLEAPKIAMLFAWLGCGSAHDAGVDEEPRRTAMEDRDNGSQTDRDTSTEPARMEVEPGSMGAAGSGATVPDDDPNPPAAEELPFGFEPDPENYVFDPNVVRQYEVEVDPAEWAQINETAYLEQYIKGKLTIEGEVVEPIGLRFKGFRGSLYNCFDFDEQGNSLGRTSSAG